MMLSNRILGVVRWQDFYLQMVCIRITGTQFCRKQKLCGLDWHLVPVNIVFFLDFGNQDNDYSS